MNPSRSRRIVKRWSIVPVVGFDLLAAIGATALAVTGGGGVASFAWLGAAVATVALRPVGSAVVLDGTLQAVRQSTLSAQANGRIAQLNVKAGDRVLIGKYSGTEVKIDGIDHVIVREDEILAIVK